MQEKTLSSAAPSDINHHLIYFSGPDSTTETMGMVAPLAQPPTQTEATPRIFFDDDDDDLPVIDDDSILRMSRRLPLGGILESTDPLRMVAMVRRTPFQFISNVNPVKTEIAADPCEEDAKNPEPRLFLCGKSSSSRKAKSLDNLMSESNDDKIPPPLPKMKSLVVPDPNPKSADGDGAPAKSKIDEYDDDEPPPIPPVQDRKRKQKPKTRPASSSSTSSSSGSSSSKGSCCRQSSGGIDDELNMRRETARLNLDVLRRLSSMLGEEREKFMAERQMLSASKDMMMAETKRVNSEKSKLDAEKQKVDLEKDLLQSQMLGRRSPRFDYLQPPTVIEA